jgi:hypothetical protein
MIMRKRQIRGPYTDGIVSVYAGKESNKSSFGAVQNVLSRSDMVLIVKLRFNSKSKRDSDLEFAEAHGRSLSMKICTPLCRAVEVNQYAVIENMLYSIYDADYDDTEKEMYLYLEEVRKL